MQQLTMEGNKLVKDLSYRYNISSDAVLHMIVSVNNGRGSMAQFNCPELGGSGQWMQGGMTMVGDMFNTNLKMTVNNLCADISNALINTQIFPVIPQGSPGSNNWWPSNLGQPFSSGAQNNTRYAIFPNRLAVEVNGKVSVYDTLDNNIGGVSQQQGGNNSLTFNSQYGTIAVSSLPIISGPGVSQAPETNFLANVTQNSSNNSNSFQNQSNAQSQSNTNSEISPSFTTTAANQLSSSDPSSSNDIIELIGKLAKLRDAGAISDSDFDTKKSELLSRL